MIRAVEFHPDAVLEAQSAFTWYRDRNISAAEAFLTELDLAVELISEHPMRWPMHVHGTRRFLLRRFPFAVVYREPGEALQVVAVAHGAESLVIGRIAEPIQSNALFQPTPVR